MALNNNEIREPSIAEFYAGKNIFITGGTGFLGTVLIEALLSSTPKIGNIYLLIREKYGSDTKERIKRLMSKQVNIKFVQLLFIRFLIFPSIFDRENVRSEFFSVYKIK